MTVIQFTPRKPKPQAKPCTLTPQQIRERNAKAAGARTTHALKESA